MQFVSYNTCKSSLYSLSQPTKRSNNTPSGRLQEGENNGKLDMNVVTVTGGSNRCA